MSQASTEFSGNEWETGYGYREWPESAAVRHIEQTLGRRLSMHEVAQFRAGWAKGREEMGLTPGGDPLPTKAADEIPF